MHRQDEEPKEAKEAGIQHQEEWGVVFVQSGFALAKAGGADTGGMSLV